MGEVFGGCWSDGRSVFDLVGVDVGLISDYCGTSPVYLDELLPNILFHCLVVSFVDKICPDDLAACASSRIRALRLTSPYMLDFTGKETMVGYWSWGQNANPRVWTQAYLVLDGAVGHRALRDLVGNKALPLVEPVTGDHDPLLPEVIADELLAPWLTVQLQIKDHLFFYFPSTLERL